MRASFIGIFALLLVACGQPATTTPESAQIEQPAGLSIENGWAPVTPRRAANAAGYFKIVNGAAAPDLLLSASSPRAESVQVHSLVMNGDVAEMQRLTNGMGVPPSASVDLEPGGFHIMFMNITAPFVAGESVPVTLTFQNAGAIETTLAVREPDAAAPAH